MNRRILFNILLLVIFVFWEMAVALAFFSEVYFCRARKMEKSYRWTRAERLYKKAVIINPLNTEYITGLADFLLRQSIYRKSTISFFEEAKSLYGFALKLNSNYANYLVTLGQIQIALFLENKEVFNKELENGLENLKKSHSNDPHGANVSYLVGYTLVSVWDYLSSNEKQIALDCLKYAIKYQYWYSEDAYRHLWKKLKDFDLLEKVTPEALMNQEKLYYFLLQNNLWKFYKKQIDKIYFYKKKEKPDEYNKHVHDQMMRIVYTKRLAKDTTNSVSKELWRGRSFYGDNFYKDGDMYWSGTMYAPIRLPGGKSRIIVQAKGTEAYGAFPYMIIRLDGKYIGDAYVNNTDWEKYEFETEFKGGVGVISITYVNDSFDKEKGQDRNLYIGEVKVIKNGK